MAQRRGTLSGPLQVSAPVTFGRMHLGPALYPFLAQHPELELELELTLELDDRRVDAAADSFDAVVRHGTLQDLRLVAWELAPSRRLLVAAPAYLARHGTPGSPQELQRHRDIFYSNRGAADWRLEGPQGVQVVRAGVGLRVNNGDIMRDAAQAGVGMRCCPASLLAKPSAQPPCA